MSAAMDTVIKHDHNGTFVWSYPARRVAATATSVRLEAFFQRDDMDLGYTTFKRNDRFVEYFYTDRWYNIFAIYDRDSSQLKGWYCNICRPATLSEDSVTAEDLALDVWIAAESYAVTLLDEDEFAELPLDEAEQEQCRLAVAELRRLAEQRLLPG